MKTTTPYQFFLRRAGFSYDPKTETQAEGKRRCARDLADAERRASDLGFSFEWQVDPEIDSSEFDDSDEPWQLWCCVCRDVDGLVRSSLGGIDFGPDKDPWHDSYRRVVEAELAMEAFTYAA